jgi:hypothetical protein
MQHSIGGGIPEQTSEWRQRVRDKCHYGKVHNHHGETMAVVQLALKAAGSESLLATLTKFIRPNILPCPGLPDRGVLVVKSGNRTLSRSSDR